MLDLQRMERIRLSKRPLAQRFIASIYLWPNYAVHPKVDIRFEGFEQVPEHPVIFAMNHTDRYNYWPFQYQLRRSADRFTATWVKGKYYQDRLTSLFMEKTNNIPAVSRGYLIHRDFLNTMQRRASAKEYAALREGVEAVAFKGSKPADAAIPAAILRTPRNILGRSFDPAREDYYTCINGLYRAMMRQFVSLNGEALDRGLDILIFPQGTRSVQLSRGHIGLAQIALYYKASVIPVGCNGSDKVYPTNNPWAKGGKVVYRFGAPVHYEDMRPYHIRTAFEPFTPEVELAHRERFQGYVDEVMQRINALLEPEYRFSASKESGGVQGSERFL